MARQRVTEARLEHLCKRLNESCDTPIKAWGDNGSNVGNYHIDHAYGGVSLHQMLSEGGSVRDVFSCGHVPKRDLEGRIEAFLVGVQSS